MFLLLAMLLTVSIAQQLPENACSQYFKYVLSETGDSQGEITLDLQNGRNRIDVRFSQRGYQNQDAVGSLLPYPDQMIVRTKLGAAQFRLSLWSDAQGVLPKLTRLTFNDVTLCSSSDYNSPQTYFNRFYMLQINGPQSALQWNSASVIRHTSFEDASLKSLVFDDPKASNSYILSEFFSEQPITAATPLPLWTPAITTTIATLTATPRQNSPPTRKPSVIFDRMNPNLTPSLNAQSAAECGQESLFSSFIQMGREYPRGMYPWLAAIYHKESFNLLFKCGGSLVSNNLVITAAHCVYMKREDRIMVSLGRHDLDNFNEDGAESRHVLRILNHPEYSTRLAQQPDADIALVTLDQPVIFNDIISPICLWEAAESEILDDIGTVAGWGTDENGNVLTRYPRDVRAKIVTELECAKKIKVRKVLGRSFCAGNLDGSGPCLGDSGGGLMIKRNNRWLLRGIVSLGQRSLVGICNNTHQYVLYSDLSKHMTWIKQNIGLSL
ncbi:serine protease gd [Drosophila grimshawi]|uniref:serine protease gd n=1 Tax=Drosophila grimshawi TaxID=7222 RepID=UPI000C86F73B|nr:serine protease gd [Drosophila grimshawi]